MESHSEKFKILSHTADLKVRVFGKTKEELFQNALFAMNYILNPEVEEKQEKQRKIKLNSLTQELLLADFLNEVLYLSQVNKEVYNEIKISELTDKLIKGTLIGKPVIRFGEDIKGVTYYSLKMVKKNGRWEATVLFDV